MEFDRIILCTDAPKGQGLASYYYKAFSDLIGSDKVFIIDAGIWDYGASFLSRGIRRVKHSAGWLAKKKLKVLSQSITSGKSIVILFNNAYISSKDIQKIAVNPSVYLVNYLSDHPYGIISSRQDEILKSIPFFQMTCTFAIDLIPVLYQLGAKRVERIPFGYCRHTHLEPTKDISIEYPNKVFYFGTWSEEIERWVKPLAAFDLQIEGNSWEKAKDERLRYIATKKKPSTDHNMAILARQAGVVVNFTRARHGCFHTMKTFELTAAGACVVTNFSNEQEEFFKGNDSISYFNTEEEMICLVDSLLKNVVAQNKIRQRALQQAFPHSYHSRASHFLSLIKAL